MKIFTIPRIIGALLLAIGALTAITGTEGWIMLGIAGLILLIAPNKSSQNAFDLYIKTITSTKPIMVALYDALYWLFVFGIAYAYQWRLQAKLAAESALTGGFSKEAALNPAMTSVTANSLKGILAWLIAGLIIELLLAWAAYVISRAYIWTTIANKKVNKKFLKQFAKLNAIWWAIWLVPFTLIALQKNQYVTTTMAFLFFVSSYFTVIMHSIFIKTEKIGHSISHGIAWGISKIHKLILPYIYVFITFVILYQAFKPFQNTAYLQPASMLFIVIVVAWTRTYLYSIIREIK